MNSRENLSILMVKELSKLEERTNVVTVQGRTLTLVGPDVKEGDIAPESTLVAEDLSEVSPLASSSGKARLLIFLASLDTNTCSIEAKKFNDALAQLHDDKSVYLISADLPFTQKRWCQTEGVKNLNVLSDYRGMKFSRSWGLFVKELELPSRAVYVVDSQNRVVYREIVAEITSEPDYEAAIQALKVAV